MMRNPKFLLSFELQIHLTFCSNLIFHKILLPTCTSLINSTLTLLTIAQWHNFDSMWTDKEILPEAQRTQGIESVA